MTCMCFFFNDTATTEIYTLSLHDALPISEGAVARDLIPVERDVPARAVERRQGEAQGVGAVLPHQVRGVHHVALGLRHLLAFGVAYEARQVHQVEGHLLSEMEGGHHHTRHPDRKSVV